MSIKTRLLLSYIAMIVVPVILFALVASSLAATFFSDMTGNGTGSGKPVFWETFSQRDELFSGVKFMAQYDPDKLLDGDLLAQTDERLERLKAALVVEKNGKAIFTSPSVDREELRKLLDASRTEQVQARKYSARRNGYLVESHKFTYADGSMGTVYLLSDPKHFMTMGRNFLLALVLSLLLIIGLTNGILTYLVSRSIVKPLYSLKQAAKAIKEGNLDHPVNLKQKDEIGELGAAFEEMRERLSESIRLQLQYEDNRKELISSISHDLKTPITGIQACVEAVMDGIADTAPKRDKYLRMIAMKSAQMNRMIDELFLFSKLDLKKLPFSLEKIDIAAYLRECVDELRLDPRMEGIAIMLSQESTHGLLVMGDLEKLHRVIMNIVDNSLKYMEKADRHIRVELVADGKDVKVTIHDNGAGIDTDAIEHIFDRFYRVDPSRNSATGGSGLGLAIVKQIVEAHGGQVWATSKKGEGTSIGFSLPLSDAQGENRS